MSWQVLFAFNLALIAAIVTPGPAFLVAVGTTLRSGRRAGLAVGCGLAVMAAAWTAMALIGLAGLFRLFPNLFIVAKTVGAAYLIFIAWMTWKGAREPVAEAPKRYAGAFADGVLVNLANPKSVLFAAAVLVVIFPPDMAPVAKALVVANHLLVEILFYSALALVMSTETVSVRYLRFKAAFDRFAAVVIGAMGLRLFFQR